MKSRLVIASLFLVLGLRAAAQCQAITAPITISSPGTWCLTKDVVQSAGSGSAIVIDSDAVTLDLHGYRVVGSGASAIFVAGKSQVVIRNGQVSSAGSGIVVSAPDEKSFSQDVLIERLVLTAIATHGIHAAANRMVIRDVTISGTVTPTQGNGIWVAGEDIDIDHAVVHEGFPIGLTTSLSATRLTVRNSVINGDEEAVMLYGGSAALTNNQLNGSDTAVGFYNGNYNLDGNRISARKVAVFYQPQFSTGKYRGNLFLDATTVMGPGTDAGNNN